MDLFVGTVIHALIEQINKSGTFDSSRLAASIVHNPLIQELIKDASEMRALRQQVNDVLKLPGR